MSTFVLGTMPAGSPAYVGYISNNVANLSLDLVITNGPITPPLVWNGNINGDWDTTTANWRTNGQPSDYQQYYPIVRLDDTLTGTSTINLTTALSPGSATSSLTVDNSIANYTFVGPGKISGVTGLTKRGSGSLILDHSGINDFTGSVNINGGAVQIGNNSARGNLPAGVAVADNGELRFARSDDFTVANVISGAGVLTKVGNGTLTLSGTNSVFTGEVIVTQGTLKLGSTGALGTTAGGTTVTNGGTLDVNGQQLNNTEPYTVSGSGSIANSSNVKVTAGATLDASARSDSTLTLTSGQTLKGSGTVLGAVIVGNGSTLAPGSPTVGTLTISNSLTLQSGSTTLMELNKAIGTNDQARGLSSVTYGGVLTVTGLGGAYVAGDTFKLFDAATYNPSSFSTINLPTNVTWNTSQLAVNGTIQVVSVSPPHISNFVNTSTNFQLTFSSPAGNSYRVWASANVAATPITNAWTVIASGVFNGTGVATISDTAAASLPLRFYVVSVP